MRKVEEWIGDNDDQNPPRYVYRRKFAEADGKCQGPCHRTLGPADKWQLDHIRRLKDALPGENLNRESNLQVLCEWCHGMKTSLENRQGAREARIQDRHLGLKKPSRFRLAKSLGLKFNWQRGRYERVEP